MRRSFSMKAVAVLVLMNVCILGGCAKDMTNQSPNLPGPKPTWDTDQPAREYEHTHLAISLDESFDSTKNVIYSPTTAVAWDALRKQAGGEVGVDPAMEAVDLLNTTRLEAKDFPSGSIATQAELTAAGGVMIRSRFEHQVRYPTTFDRIAPIKFDGEPSATYQAFGVKHYIPFDALGPAGPDFGKPDVGKQIRIIWHEFIDEESEMQNFIVELMLSNVKERLILAAIPPEETLGKTVQVVKRRLESPNTLTLEAAASGRKKVSDSELAELNVNESLMVPIIDFDVLQQFTDLQGKSIRCPNPHLNGGTIERVQQRTKLRLDEAGVKVFSESELAVFARSPRNFAFDRPFLVLMMRKDADWPYLAAWVGQPEILVKASY